MIGRQIRGLKGHVQTLRRMQSDLEAYDEPRISLPVGEAARHMALAEAHLADAADTAEAELYLGNVGRRRRS